MQQVIGVVISRELHNLKPTINSHEQSINFYHLLQESSRTATSSPEIWLIPLST